MRTDRRIAPSGDDREDRVRELLLFGNEKHAEAVSRCRCWGEHPEELLKYGTCKLRCCPACTRCLALIIEDEALEALKRIARPVVIRLSLPASDPFWLRATWATFRELVARLRAEILPGVSRAFGVFYSVVNDESASVRLELAIGTKQVDLVRLEEAWHRLTGGDGAFSLLRKLPSDLHRLADYFGRPTRFFPRPGRLPAGAYRFVLIAMKGRRLTLNWVRRRCHTSRRGRR